MGLFILHYPCGPNIIIVPYKEDTEGGRILLRWTRPCDDTSRDGSCPSKMEEEVTSLRIQVASKHFTL